MAHGITMGLPFLVLFPAGAVFIRTLSIKQTMWIHASCQMIGVCLMLAGFATGMRMGNILNEVCLFTSNHRLHPSAYLNFFVRRAAFIQLLAR